jgi:hypothetical protein
LRLRRTRAIIPTVAGVRAFIALAVAVVALVTAPGSLAELHAADSPTFVVNKQIGDIRLSESEARVGYDYGGDCIKGCPGVREQGACVLGLSDCIGPMYRYKVSAGYLRVGYRQADPSRPGVVVYLETNSTRYKTRQGLGVGSKIPFGKRYGVFRWHACSPSDGYWVAATSWAPYRASTAMHRAWTQLNVIRGRVASIQMWRGDVNVQEC